MPAFSLGSVQITRAALHYCETNKVDPIALLRRHHASDWGDLEQQDIKANEEALAYGGRIFSSYKLNAEVKLWVITEADRSSTCVLLPSDY